VKGLKRPGVKRANAVVIPKADANPQKIEFLEAHADKQEKMKKAAPPIKRYALALLVRSSMLCLFRPSTGGVTATSSAGRVTPTAVATNPTATPMQRILNDKPTFRLFTKKYS